MSIPVEIHGGGSNNESRYSIVPGVCAPEDGFHQGFVTITLDTPLGVRTATVESDSLFRSKSDAFEDAKRLATMVDINTVFKN